MSKSFLFRVFSVLLTVSMLLAACTPAAPAAPAAEPNKAPAAAEPTKAPAAPEPTKAPEPTQAPEPTKPPEPTLFRIAVNTDIDTWDPHGNRTMSVAAILDYVVETLVETDNNGTVLPGLAKSWESSADGLELTFHLQENVKFSDGTPFDAEAVKWNIERMNDPNVKTASKSPYDRIKTIEVIDPLTVKFKLDKFSAPLLQTLASTNIAMVSPTSLPKDSEAYIAIGLNIPVGTGPYIMTEFKPGDHVQVERNPNYWGKQPYYDKVFFQIAPDAATRESLLLSGKVDMAILPPVTDLPALQANPDITVEIVPIDRLLFVQFNTTKAPFDNPKVRQAFNYAVDKKAIVDNVLRGLGKPAVAPMPDSFFGWCDVGKPYDYNPDKARELLKEAGIPEGFKVRFLAPTGRYPQDFQVGEAIAGYLQEVGIDAKPETMDWPTYTATVLKPPAEQVADLYVMGWGSPYLHGSHTMLMFNGAQIPPNGFNASYYNVPEVNEAIVAAEGEPDQAKAAKMYCDLNTRIWEDAPWIFMYQMSYAVAYSSKVTGVGVHPSDKYQAVYVHPK